MPRLGSVGDSKQGRGQGSSYTECPLSGAALAHLPTEYVLQGLTADPTGTWGQCHSPLPCFICSHILVVSCTIDHVVPWITDHVLGIFCSAEHILGTPCTAEHVPEVPCTADYLPRVPCIPDYVLAVPCTTDHLPIKWGSSAPYNALP